MYVQHHCPLTPILLVGTKYDLLTPDSDTQDCKKGQEPVTLEEGKALAVKIGAVGYFEGKHFISILFFLRLD
jgi:hypothetical protein